MKIRLKPPFSNAPRIVTDGLPNFTYYKSVGKKPITSEPLTYDDVKDDTSYCVQIPEGFVVLDFDTTDAVKTAIKIIKGENLKCRIMRTTRGIHVWFRAKEPWKNFTKQRLVCGILADCRSYGKFSCACWRVDGVDRQWIRETPWDEVQIVPPYFHRGTKLTQDFGAMVNGDGRNQALTEYIWSLQSHGFTPEDIRLSYKIINNYVFAESLPDQELETIVRDDTFKSMDSYEKLWFTDKGGFLHNELAKYLLSLHDIVYNNGDLYIYEAGFYQTLNENRIYQMVHREYPNSTSHQRAEVLASIKAQLFTQEPNPPHQWVINCSNGRLDVRSGELYPHSPDHFDFQQIPTIFDGAAKDDLLDRTLDKLFPTQGALDLFEEMAGYCLIKSLPFRCAFYMVGDGANGKSTILRLLMTMLGDQNCSMLAPEQITTDGFMLAELENKLANIGDDIGSYDIRDSATFKKACTGEPMIANRKYRDPFTLESYATLIFAANEMPNTRDTSYGSDSRRVILPLDARFTADDPEFDPFIADKLTRPHVMSALLNRALTGAQRLLKRNQFTMPAEVLEAEKKYRSESSYIGQWLSDMMYTDKDLEGRTVVDVRQEFLQWCADNKVRKTPSVPQIGRQIVRLLPNLSTRIAYQDGKSQRVYTTERED